MAFRIVLEISTRSVKFIEPMIWSVDLTAANVGRFGCERVTAAERETSWRFNDGKGAPQFTQIFAGGDALSEFFVDREKIGGEEDRNRICYFELPVGGDDASAKRR